MNTAAVIDKVRKLLRLAGSPNEHEAALAAAKAQELIDQHQLQTALLSIDESTTTSSDDEPITNFADSPLDVSPAYARWRATLAVGIASHNGCRIWRQGGHLMIVGRPSDADAVRYLFGWLAGEVERLATENGAGKGRTWRNNFRLGVIDTILRKLREQHRQWLDSTRAEATKANALVVVNKALVRIEQRRGQVDAWMKDNLSLSRGRASTARCDYDARNAGRAAGEGVSVSRSRPGLSGGPRGLIT